MAKRKGAGAVVAVLGVLGLGGIGLAIAAGSKKEEGPAETPEVGPPVQPLPEPSPVTPGVPPIAPPQQGNRLNELRAAAATATAQGDVPKLKAIAAEMRQLGANTDAQLVETAIQALEAGSQPVQPPAPGQSTSPGGDTPDGLRAEAMAAIAAQDTAKLASIADRMDAIGMTSEAAALRTTASVIDNAKRNTQGPVELPEPEEEEPDEEPEEQGTPILVPSPFPIPSPPPPIAIPEPPPIEEPPAPSPGPPAADSGPPVLNIPPITVPEPPPVTPPPTPTSLQPTTAAMLKEFLSREQAPGWKEASRDSTALKAWQTAAGTTPDGKFGPGSAKRLALETGLLPIIRFWPAAAGTNPKGALDRFRNDLATLAASAPEPRKTQLLAAMSREKGQSFGAGSGLPAADGGVAPVSPTITI